MQNFQPKRITRGEDYRTVVRTGIRVGGRYMTTHAVLSSTEETRFGFIIAKTVGNAVKRNLMRRRLNGITHEIHPPKKPLDVVFRAKPEIINASYSQLKSEVEAHILNAQERLLK